MIRRNMQRLSSIANLSIDDIDGGAHPSPDYSWMGVWRMSGEDQIRALTRQYNYRRFPFRSGVEIHLSGERRVYPDTLVEQALHASVCGKPE